MQTSRLTAALVLAGLMSGCALRPTAVQDYGIPGCPAAAERDLLSSDALQCWFNAAHGRWRLIGQQSHLEALVVEVQGQDLRDAAEIARRVREAETASAFSEVLVYVQAAPVGGVSRVRRVRWTRTTGYETLDFSAPSADSPLNPVVGGSTRPAP